MSNQPLPTQPAPTDELRALSEHEIEWILQVSYLYVQLEKWDSAKCLLEALLVFEPNHIDGLVNLSYVNMETQNYQMALKICEKLLNSSLKQGDRQYDKKVIENLRRLTLQKLTDQKRRSGRR